VTGDEWRWKAAEILRDHCQPTNIKAVRLTWAATLTKLSTIYTYNTPSDWGGKFTARKHLYNSFSDDITPHSVLLSKMDGEEELCDAIWDTYGDRVEFWG